MKHKTLNDVLYAAIKSKDISIKTKESLIREYLLPKIVFTHSPISIKDK